METFELRYFKAVAETESVNKAASVLNISSSALSKAVNRLEEELQVDLFARDGRHIRLTEKGRLLLEYCSRILELETQAKVAIAEEKATFEVSIAGPELLLSNFGLQLVSRLKDQFAGLSVQFHNTDVTSAQSMVLNRQCDLCIISEPETKFSDLTYKQIESAVFRTYVSPNHPLGKGSRPVPIEEVLKHDFLAPESMLLGSLANSTISTDGWRDDRFPRRLAFKGVGLKTMENLLLSGRAITYVPEYLIQGLKLKKLDITGCPYQCKQSIFLVARNPRAKHWLKPFFGK